MRAITVFPGRPHSARFNHIVEPAPADGSVLARTLALGICGTDRDIVAGDYGTALPGHCRLMLGHAPGDLVVGIVRRPDPAPCPACALRRRPDEVKVVIELAA